MARAGWPGSARCDASPARYLARGARRGNNGAAVVFMGCGGAYGLRWWLWAAVVARAVVRGAVAIPVLTTATLQ